LKSLLPSLLGLGGCLCGAAVFAGVANVAGTAEGKKVETELDQVARSHVPQLCLKKHGVIIYCATYGAKQSIIS
jgi:hypothetical protein